MLSTYTKTTINMILFALVLLGSLNYLMIFIGYDIMKNIPHQYAMIIYIIIVISAIILAFNRTTWLPFLGKSVFPSALVPLKQLTNYDRIITVKTKPNSKVAYWASSVTLSNGMIPDVDTAYGDYSNSGVVMSDENGIANFPIMEGSSYIVPSNRIIDRHVHYRIIGLEHGMIGKIHTKKY
jgi:hypothetical protein